MTVETQKTILLVEDESILALIETEQLNNYGYRVLHARNGEEAIKTVRNGKYNINLILMDIDLGDGIDGTETAQEILNEKDVPIVFLSSHTEPEIVKKTEKITSYGYVVKSSSITVLDASIKMAFKLFREKQKVRERGEELTAVNEELEVSYEEISATNETLIQTNEELEKSQIEIFKSKEILREHKEYLQSIFRAAPTGIGVVINRIITNVNNRLCEMTGYSEKELINQSARMLYPTDEDYEYVGKEKYKQISKYGTGTVETLLKCKNNIIIDVLLSSTPMDINDLSKGVTFTALDITERKQIQEKHKQITENIETVLWEFDIDKDSWTYVSPQSEKILGYKPEEWTNLDFWTEHIHKDDREWASNYCAECVARGESHKFEYRFLKKNGEVIWLRDVVNIEMNNGTPKKMRGFMSDVTNRKKIQSLLKEKEILLKEMHHRIKNNMSVIKGLLFLQANSTKNPEIVKSLQDAIARIESMKILYDKLYKAENYSDISIKEYLVELTNEVFQIFPKKQNIKLETQITDFNINTETIFPLGIIINELLTNAMKYAFTNRNSGLIRISVTKKKNQGTIIFEDNGIGIKNIEENKGKGFGLELIEMLTDQINGSCEIESNNGTKFIIKFEI